MSLSESEWESLFLREIDTTRSTSEIRAILHADMFENDGDNAIMDEMIEDASKIYPFFYGDNRCRDPEGDTVQWMIRYQCALIANDSDDLWDRLTDKARDSIDETIRVVKEWLTKSSRSSRRDPRDRNSRNSRNDRSGRRDTREPIRSSRDSRGSSRRSGRRDGASRRGSGEREVNTPHVQNIMRAIENNAKGAEINPRDNDRDNGRRDRSRNDESRQPAPKIDNPVTEVKEVEVDSTESIAPVGNKYLPQLQDYNISFDPVSLKAWHTVYFTHEHFPMYEVSYQSDGQCDISREAFVGANSREADEMKKASGILSHKDFLFFKNRGSDVSKPGHVALMQAAERLNDLADIAVFEDVFDISISEQNNTYKPSNKSILPDVFFTHNMVVREVVVDDALMDSTYFSIHNFLSRTNAVDPHLDLGSVIVTTAVKSYTQFKIIDNTGDLMRTLLSLSTRRNFEMLQNDVKLLEEQLGLREFNIINDQLTDHVNEILDVELGLGLNIKSFVQNINSAMKAIENDFGRQITELFGDVVPRIISANLRYDSEINSEDLTEVNFYREETVVLLPLAARQLDLAITNDSGVGMVSPAVTPRLHEGLVKILNMFPKARHVKLVTTDNSVVYVHRSPMNNTVLLRC